MKVGAMLRCLLIEDDPDLASWLIKSLGQRQIFVDWEDSGRMGTRRALTEDYDAIILDLGLPDLDGAQVLARVRAAGGTRPILVATAQGDLAARVALLHAGADDFLTKPFALDELEARLIALQRRVLGRASGGFSCGPLRYDGPSQQFFCADAPLQLTPREHALLLLLIRRPGEPQSKTHILDRLVGDDANLNPETIEVIIYRLRRKLEGRGVRVVTLRGLGYFLETDDDAG